MNDREQGIAPVPDHRMFLLSLRLFVKGAGVNNPGYS